MTGHRFAYGVAAAIGIVVGGLAGIFTYGQVLGAIKSDAREEMESLIEQRAEAEQDLFTDLIAAERAMVDIYTRTYENLSAEQANDIFERAFPAFGDGTRRTPDALYEGMFTEIGQLVYGIGGFMGMRNGLDAERIRAMAAGYLTIRQAGPVMVERFDNFYFFDDQNNMVMFGPRREDRLVYYRQDAPADFDFHQVPMSQIVLPASNPSGRVVCTGLENLLYRRDERLMAIGCHTPVRLSGRHVGAIGTSLDLTEYLYGVVSAGTDAVITADGNLVAHADLMDGSTINEARVDAVIAWLEPEAMARAVTGHGRTSGVVEVSGLNGLVGYVHLDAPGWYIVTRRDYGPVVLQAAGFGFAVALLIFVGLLSQARTISRFLPFGPNGRLSTTQSGSV